MSLKKRNKSKTLQNSDPGKLLDLIMNLDDEHCSHLQNKINVYVSIDLLHLIVAVSL